MADIPPPPAPPPAAPLPAYQPPPGYQAPPPGSPGYMPQPIGPTSAGGLNLGVQLAGGAASIGLGILGILLPIVTAMFFGGTVYFFVVLPIIGLIRGVQAITKGFLIGGLVGIALNVVAGVLSLTASGMINPGG